MVSVVRKNYQGLTIENLPSGKQRVRVRVEGFPNKKIRLNVGIDHPKLSEHYWNARAGTELEAEPESYAVRRSLAWLVEKYLTHLENMVEANQASPLTLRKRKSVLNRLCAITAEDGGIYGEKRLEAPTAAFVHARDSLAATSGTADDMIKSARAMYKWAIDVGIAKINPVTGVSKIHRSKGGATPWTAQDLRTFKAKHPHGTMAHLALTLHMFTAARSSDAIWLGLSQEFQSNGIRWLGWQPEKRGSSYVEIPMAKPLCEAINAVTTIGPAYLLNSYGKPFSSPDSYRNWFKKRLNEAVLPQTLDTRHPQGNSRASCRKRLHGAPNHGCDVTQRTEYICNLYERRRAPSFGSSSNKLHQGIRVVNTIVDHRLNQSGPQPKYY
jgi:hypothetical protein